MGGYVPIDQNDVPESQHTVFIRGLPGDLSTDRVKNYIDEKVGRCSFDFVKQSPDKSRLFVAVRFDSRDVARDFMREYNGADLLGTPVELSWFKDIRRYVSYQQAQGNLPVPPRGGPGGGGMMSRGRPPFRGGGGGGAPYPPRGTYAPRGGRGTFYNRGGFDSNYRGRPPMRAPSGYRVAGGMISRTISNRRSRSHSRSSGSYHSRSRSRSSRRRSLSRSPSRSLTRSPSVRRTPPSPEPRKSRSKSPNAPPLKKLAKKAKKHKKNKHRKRSESRSSGEITDTEELDQASPKKRPKRRRSESANESENGSIATSRASVPAGPRQSPSTIKIEARSTHRQVILDPVDSSRMNGTDSDRPESAISSNPADGVLSEMKMIQNSILAAVKTEEKDRKAAAALAPPKKKEGFKLSSFTKQISAESEREKKVSQLSAEKVEQLNVKRKDLELAYKQDCETFGTVVKMLISKDPALEDRLLASLRESLKDIGSKFVTELDEYIDELLAN